MVRVGTQHEFDVLAINGIDVDWLFQLPKLPTFDEKLPAHFLGCFPGGPVGNFACIGSNLGLRVAAFCVLGDDDGGKLLLGDFQNNGVDTTYVTVKENLITPFVIVLVDPSGEKAVVVPDHLAELEFEYLPTALSKSSYAYLAPKDYDTSIEIVKLANQLGVKVYADIEPGIDLSDTRLMELMRNIEIASFNEQGFINAVGQKYSNEGARSLLALGPEIVLVTRGKDGVIGVTKEKSVEQPAFNVDVEDTTGAGDTFNAAFLYALIKDWSLEAALKFGSAAAAIVISKMGTRTSMPTVEEIEDFL